MSRAMSNPFSKVRELLPSEQGLRHDVAEFSMKVRRIVRELLPSEQGLRLETAGATLTTNIVRELLPSEQGLRQIL